MDFSLSETQEMIASGAREFLTERVSKDALRGTAAGDEEYSGSWWQEIAQLGWPGILVPEEAGGAGLGILEMGSLLEEWGAALAPGPLLETALLGVSAIDRLGNSGQRQEYLPALAAGEMVATPAIHEERPAWARQTPETSARFTQGGWTISGEKRFVPFAADADLMLVSASTGQGEDDCTVFLVRSKNAAGLELTPLQTSTGSPLYLARLHDVEAPEDSVLGEVGKGRDVIENLTLLGAVGRSLQMAGAAQRVVDLTVKYVSERRQFGRPAGSFQAVQHHCANMAIAAKSMTLLARKAAWAAAEGSGSGPAASFAKLKANKELPRVCSLAHQCHGAIGFTWEHDLHLFTRHALQWRSEYGDTNYHRQRLMAAAAG